jgi:hypothetical protein
MIILPLLEAEDHAAEPHERDAGKDNAENRESGKRGFRDLHIGRPDRLLVDLPPPDLCVNWGDGLLV